MSTSPTRRRVVITGIGPLTPIGIGIDSFTAGVRAEKSAVNLAQSFDTSPMRAKCAAELAGFDPADFFPPHRLKRLDRYAQLSVYSSRLAIEDSGLAFHPDSLSPRAGVSFGTALGGVANAETQCQQFLERGFKGVSRALALMVFGGSAHANIAIEFGLTGPGTTNSNSCASGHVAFGDAFKFIRDDLADVVITGGAESPLSPLTFGAFDLINTMSRFTGDPPSHACRPFHRDRDGFVMGEGAAAFVFEEFEHAKRRGAHIYGELLGWSLTNDAFHMTTPRPGGEPAVRAIKDALAAARLNPSDIGYINAHASSTVLNDDNELACIREVFGEAAHRIPISGTKAYTGHPLGATCAIELAFCLLTLNENLVPPTLHLDDPDPAFADFDLVPNHCRDADVRYVLSNAFGFGGINSCIVVGKV